MTNRRHREAREAKGRRAEVLAALWLELKGYRILARRYQSPGGEIDLVAARPLWGRPRLIVFVEVKAREDAAALAEAITPHQRRRIEAAASAYLGANPRFAGAACRFDGVLMARAHLPRHCKNLWQTGD